MKLNPSAPGRTNREIDAAMLVKQHYASVYRFMHRLCNNTQDAEDLTQETFSVVWSKMESFNGHSSISTWIHAIAYRRFLQSRRSDQRRRHREESRVVNSSPTDSPVCTAADRERIGSVHDAIASLNTNDRSVIVMHYLQGMAYSEMAEVLRRPIGSVKSRTHTALRRLRVLLNGKLD